MADLFSVTNEAAFRLRLFILPSLYLSVSCIVSLCLFLSHPSLSLALFFRNECCGTFRAAATACDHPVNTPLFVIRPSRDMTLRVTVQFALNGWLLSQRAAAPSFAGDFYFAFCQEEWRRPGVAASPTLRRMNASHRSTLPSHLQRRRDAAARLSASAVRGPHRTNQANDPPSIPLKQLLIYIFHFAASLVVVVPLFMTDISL